MRKLWNEVGFVPSSFTLNSGEDEELQYDAPLKTGSFAPKLDIPILTEKEKEKFQGITIGNFNPSVDNKEILDFLHKSLFHLLFLASVSASLTFVFISLVMSFTLLPG